jgi:hypothetical protein
MQSSRKATNLQIAAFVVAIFRYMAMGGMAVGFDIFRDYQIFIWLEVFSWAGMAILEGFAMPFISKGMRQFPTNSFYWKQLLFYRIVLLAAIPVLGAPLYAAASRNSTIEGVLAPIHPGLYWLWLLLFAGLVALIVDAVGIVDELPAIKEEKQADTGQLEAEAWGIMAMGRKEGRWIYPPELVQKMGNRITVHQAVQFASAWHKATNTRPGVKSVEEKEFEISLNGVN